jgi:putative Ca2+/H+ antiporter (TMEM165/GDT1 family)
MSSSVEPSPETPLEMAVEAPPVEVESGVEPAPAESAPAEASPAAGGSFALIAFTTFTTVFLAELGDKTQLAALLLSAQSGRPVLVFFGAALALICSSLVGVLLGRWLASVLPAERLARISGLLMIALGLWLGAQATAGLLTP